ncbi:hypothetical protein [Treponema phagedenis]|uniref:Uncharacterized protein n=3 Tax=Treponema phagedenis TaxID=162 RepID=A0A0B7GUX5_TREPH|nr:hypothetical protein [Treponema phagedenis]EFW37156.1 hypothetical protein HMPREF9554_02364 [Treponema phagedenis F0421]QLC58594.1 hypothetical protein HW453_07060 [Treponema phagedenis]CEM60770.1 conserved hypothetical protein [Treponema phagedenis]
MQMMEKVQIATYRDENDANKFLATLEPADLLDIKVTNTRGILCFTIIYKVNVPSLDA